MYTSFGYSLRHDENMEVLAVALDALMPGGHLLVDMASPALLRRLPCSDFQGEHSLVTRTMQVDERERLLHVDYDVLRDGERKHFAFTVPIFHASTLESMLAEAGFVNIRSYSSLDGDPFDEVRPTRLIVVGQKRA
jgi:hypothetical protein